MAILTSYDEFVRQMFIEKVDEWLQREVTVLPFPTYVLQYEDMLKEKYREYVEESEQ